MKLLNSVFILTFLAGSMAYADQYETILVKEEKPKYSVDLSYPKLLSGSVSAFLEINQVIEKTILENGCDEDMLKDSSLGGYYYVRANVIGLNRNYVGIQVNEDSYCGGAHPNNAEYYLTFDSNTGENLKILEEFGVNYETADPLMRAVSKIMLKEIPKESQECLENMTETEKLETLQGWYSLPVALAAKKQIVLAVDPPHVLAACRFSVRVSYLKVRNLLKKNSRIHKWMR